jgi:hypothetical protein
MKTKSLIYVSLIIAAIVGSVAFEVANNLVTYQITAQVKDVRLAPGDSGSTTYVVYLQDGRTLELMRSWIHSGPNEDKMYEALLGAVGQTATFYCYGIQLDWGPWYYYPNVYDVQIGNTLV